MNINKTKKLIWIYYLQVYLWVLRRQQKQKTRRLLFQPRKLYSLVLKLFLYIRFFLLLQGNQNNCYGCVSIVCCYYCKYKYKWIEENKKIQKLSWYIENLFIFVVVLFKFNKNKTVTNFRFKKKRRSNNINKIKSSNVMFLDRFLKWNI